MRVFGIVSERDGAEAAEVACRRETMKGRTVLTKV